MAKNRQYPHISDTEFPDLNTVDAYKYKNTVDYDAYGDTVKIKLMNVPWCGDYDNVVYFESIKDRDKWFNDQVNEQNSPVCELSSMFRLYSHGNIKIPLPIDEAMKYNYCYIDYGKLPNQSKASENSKMFYFIQGMDQASVNATDIILELDVWTTFIHQYNIQYMNLVRGHAPMTTTTVDKYLQNPVENSEYLLTPDVNYGDGLQRVGSEKHTIINDSNEMYLCFATSGDVTSSWGNTTKTRAMYNSQMLSNVQVVGCELSQWSTFRSNIESQLPQFLQTVKAMFVIPKKLLSTTGSAFTIAGVEFHFFSSNTNKKLDNYKFTKAAFGYDSKYSNIAKLYTYPYAALEVNDFNGNTTQIRVEECGSELGMYVVTNIMYPYINTEAYLTGMGGASNSTLSFYQSSSNKFTIGGRDYNFNTQWDIPCFAVQLTASNDWTLNGKIGADASLASSNASASTGKTNADNAASTSKLNSTDSADASELNSMTSSNTSFASMNSSNAYSYNVYQNTVDIQAAHLALNISQSASAFKLGVDFNAQSQSMSAATNIATGAVTGLAGGPIGSIVGATGAAITSGITGAVIGMQTSNKEGMINRSAQNQREYLKKLYGFEYNHNWDFNTSTFNDLYPHSEGDPTDSLAGTTGKLARSQSVQQNIFSRNANKATRENSKNLLLGGTRERTNESGEVINTGDNYVGTVNRSYNNSINSNARSYNTSVANNQRSYDASHNQTLLSSHPEFGGGGGTPGVCDKPMGVRYTVVTQSKNAIRQAAEQFRRYGYMLNMEWKVTTFNLMTKFTYWQADALYCDDSGLSENFQKAIQNILLKGTTVWANPKDIGKTSIYSNEVK